MLVDAGGRRLEISRKPTGGPAWLNTFMNGWITIQLPLGGTSGDWTAAPGTGFDPATVMSIEIDLQGQTSAYTINVDGLTFIGDGAPPFDQCSP